ncbi:hypothetical protein L7F22_050716, partial [Adiantum nelumboides]|nr:hypothetical protein [Adiantum nelumboides]
CGPSLSLLVCGKAKLWYNGLHDKEKENWEALKVAFLCNHVPDAQLDEVKWKLDEDKMETDEPTTYVEASGYASDCTKKILKKRWASQGLSSVTVPKSIEG